MNRLILTAAILAMSSQAMAGTGKCLLVVKGKTYINGPCLIDTDADGSFRINVGEKKPSPYFVYFDKNENGTTGASWNEDPRSTHAHTSLGEGFTEKAGCWTNRMAKICAWPK